MRTKSPAIVTISIILVLLFTILVVEKRWPTLFDSSLRHKYIPNQKALKVAEEFVKVEVTPAFKFSFDFMKSGVIQHLDRQYTYDVIPKELLNGLLFQGIHRPPQGTIIKFRLFSPASIYFFFHYTVDGGYSDIFSSLKDWRLCAVAPQYDTDNGDHGLKMLMYQLDADTGTYTIPATTSDRACFSIVFQKGVGN